MRIVHLSDVHLSDKNIDELRNFYIERLTEDLEKIQRLDNKKIDIIAITGDLVDRGGHSLKKHYHGNFSNPYDFFEAEFITPIREKLNLTNSNFIFIPGNHDIDESEIKWIEEKRLKALNPKGVNDELDKIRFDFTDANKRIKAFKEFENKFHEDTQKMGYHFSNNESTYIFESRGGEKVGFLLVNDSWRCSTCKIEDEKNEGFNDHLFGTNQLIQGYNRIKGKANLNIGLFHHDISDLKESKEILSIANGEIPLFLCGHKHNINNEPFVDNLGQEYLRVFRPRAALNKPDEIIEEFMIGYQIYDINVNTSIINKINYRRYSRKGKIGFFTDSGDYSDDNGVNEMGIQLGKPKTSHFDFENLNSADYKNFEK